MGKIAIKPPTGDVTFLIAMDIRKGLFEIKLTPPKNTFKKNTFLVDNF